MVRLKFIVCLLQDGGSPNPKGLTPKPWIKRLIESIRLSDLPDWDEDTKNLKQDSLPKKVHLFLHIPLPCLL